MPNVQRIKLHGRVRAQEVAILNEVVILGSGNCVSDIQSQRVVFGLAVQDGLEASQSAELSAETATGLQPPMRIASEVNREFEIRPVGFATSGQQEREAGQKNYQEAPGGD